MRIDSSIDSVERAGIEPAAPWRFRPGVDTIEAPHQLLNHDGLAECKGAFDPKLVPVDGASIDFRVAVTDRDWLDYFRNRPQLSEMNFWRPGTPNTRVERGTPWIFLVKPNSVAGIAVVELAHSLPLFSVWDVYGKSNGFEDRDAFFARIGQYRHRETSIDSEIGCVALVSPVFFDAPFDFRPYANPN
jgi:hypothetical protein